MLGLQGNLWCEFIPTVAKAEYMLYPRAFAIAEIGWSPQEVRDWKEFRPRAIDYIEVIKSHGYNAFDLSAEKGNRDEMYKRLDHLAQGRPLTFNTPYDKGYHGSWDVTLNDGLFGSWEFPDDRWLGFRDGVDVTIDLGEVKDLHYVGGSFWAHAPEAICPPEKVEVWLSDDGNDWHLAGYRIREIPDAAKDIMVVELTVPLVDKGRYVRFKALRRDLPECKLMFLDEVIVL